MAFDAMVTHAVVSELNACLKNGKIDKIYQPEREEIVLAVRTSEKTHKLLLSASPNHPRVHLTTLQRENPASAPLFCMFLRKHLKGSRLVAVSQEGLDRVIRIETEGRNELGDLCTKFLIAEVTGRNSNIILTDEHDRISDSIRHIDFSVSSVRQILPGLQYDLPPAQDKLSPIDFSSVAFLKEVEEAPEDMPLSKLLLSYFSGISPLLARESVFQFAGHTDALCRDVNAPGFVTFLQDFFQKDCFAAPQPSVVISQSEQKPVAFSCVRLTQYPGDDFCIKESDSVSAVIEEYFVGRALREHMNQRAASLIKTVKNNIDRCRKKMAIHEENLHKSEHREQYKIYGDLLTANLYRLSDGQKSAKVLNYYENPPKEMEIPLQEEKTPVQNAQRYFKMYAKAKMTAKYAAEQAEEAKRELFYLESVLLDLQNAATPAELAEIQLELSENGYLRKQSAPHKKSTESTPRRFISSDGFEILVGRNNHQNDKLTLKMAYATDLWFHTKSIPGSHTIIRTEGGKEVPERTLLEAAGLAAYFSKARESSKVPVDYTQIKNVKKPSGARPGMVIYKHNQTVYVEPFVSLAETQEK